MNRVLHKRFTVFNYTVYFILILNTTIYNLYLFHCFYTNIVLVVRPLRSRQTNTMFTLSVTNDQKPKKSNRNGTTIIN